MNQRLASTLKCPSCGSKNDGATLVEGAESISPKDGDLGVCFYCGTIYAYQDDVTTLKEVSDEELAKYPMELLTTVDRARWAIMRKRGLMS